MPDNFKFIINTELQFNAGSLKKLIEDVKNADRTVRRYIDSQNKFEFQMSLNKNSVTQFEQQVQKALRGISSRNRLQIEFSFSSSAISNLQSQISSAMASHPVSVQAEVAQSSSTRRNIANRGNSSRGRGTNTNSGINISATEQETRALNAQSLAIKRNAEAKWRLAQTERVLLRNQLDLAREAERARVYGLGTARQRVELNQHNQYLTGQLKQGGGLDTLRSQIASIQSALNGASGFKRVDLSAKLDTLQRQLEQTLQNVSNTIKRIDQLSQNRKIATPHYGAYQMPVAQMRNADNAEVRRVYKALEAMEKANPSVSNGGSLGMGNVVNMIKQAIANPVSVVPERYAPITKQEVNIARHSVNRETEANRQRNAESRRNIQERRQQQRQEAQARRQQEREYNAVWHNADLENQLRNPSIPYEEKVNNIIPRLNQHYSSLAQQGGQNLYRRHFIRQEMPDGTVSSVHTPLLEYDKLGNVIDKSNKSMNDLFNTMLTKMFVFKTLEQGLLSISNALKTGIKDMADFQAEFVQVQNIANYTNGLIDNGTLPSGSAKFSTDEIQQSVFNIANKYGLNPTNMVLPAVKEIMRRPGMDANSVQRMTQMVAQGALIAHGPDVTEEEMQKMSDNLIAIQQQYYKPQDATGGNGLNALQGYMDYLANLSNQGTSIDKTMEAMGELSKYSAQNGLDLKYTTALAGSFENIQPQTSGEEITTVVKGFLNNLVKPNGNGSQVARQLLGIGTMDSSGMPTDMNQIVHVIADRIKNGQLSDSTINLVAQELASQNGRGGSAMVAKYENMIQATTNADNLMNGGQTSNTTAEQQALKQVDTLKGAFNQLNSELDQLSVNLGASGILGGLTKLTQGFTGLIGAINQVLGVWRQFGQMTEKYLGTDITQSITNILALVAAFKTLQFAYSRMPYNIPIADKLLGSKSNTVTNAATNLVTDVASNVVANKITNTASKEVAPAVSSGIGSGVGEILGSIIGTRSTMTRSAALKAGTTAVGDFAANGIAKVLTGFMDFLPVIGRLLLTFGKLSLVGAALSLAFEGVTWLFNKAKQEQDQKDANYQAMLKDPKKLAQFTSDLQSYHDIQTTWDKDGTAYKKRQQILDRLNQYGIADAQFSGSYSNPNKLDYTYTDEKGNKQQATADVTKKQEYDLMVNRLTAQAQAIVNVDEAWQRANDHVTEYMQLLTQVQEATSKLALVNQYVTTASQFNGMQFQGATDSAGYYGAMTNIYARSMSPALSQYQQMVQAQSTINANMVDATNNADTNRAKLEAYDQSHGTTLAKDMDALYSQLSAQGSGGLQQFLDRYDPRKDASKNANAEDVNLQYQYAAAKWQQGNLQENQKNIQDQANQAINTFAQYATQLKQMYTNFLVAASGAQVFEARLKNLQTTTAQMKTIQDWTYNRDAKVGATKTVFGDMALESQNLKEELDGVASAISAIKSLSPNEDFSLTTLYNPQQGLSSNQDAVKQLLDKQSQLTQNYTSSLDSLRQQQEAIVQAVMATDKYRVMWDSVTQRIQLAKSLATEMRDTSSQEITNSMMVNFRSNLFGNAFDASGTTSQNYAQSRDSYLSIAEKAQNALNTYGDDTAKLQQAIKDINSGSVSISDQLKSAFVDPLSNIINNQVSQAVKSQSDSSSTFQQSVGLFQQATNDLWDKISNMKISVNSDGKLSVTQDTTSASAIATTPKSAIFDPSKPSSAYKQPGDDPNDANLTDNQLMHKYQDYFKAKFAEDANQSQNQGGTNFTDALQKASLQYNIPDNLLYNIMMAESSGNPFNPDGTPLTSPAGAIGLMQFLPGTAQQYGIDPTNPTQSIYGAAHYLSDLYGSTGDWSKAVAAYNAGLGNVQKYGGIPPFQETQDYVKKVLNGTTIPTQNSAQNAAQENTNAQQQLQQIVSDAKYKALIDQAGYLTNNSVPFDLDSAIRNAQMQAQFAGQYAPADGQGLGGYVFTNQKMDAVQQARLAIAQRLFEEQQSTNGMNALISQKQGDLANAQNSGNAPLADAIQKQITTLQDSIKAIQDNSDQLKQLDQHYADFLNQDPRYNAIVSNNQMTDVVKQLSDMSANGQNGDIGYYKLLTELNDMYGNYLTRQKQTDIRRTAFDNLGVDYSGLNQSNQNLWQENVQKLKLQIQQIGDTLGQYQQGTNAWHLVLQDEVKYQQQLVDLENQKLQTTQQYFALTSHGVQPYINDRAFVQSRDYVTNLRNMNTATYNYQNAQGMDSNEQLANLQIISEAHQKLTQQMNDYRDAVVEAFKAGAISIQDYIQRLYDLRNIQDETKQQTADMMSSITGGFQQSFADALKSGMEGNFNAQLDFATSIRQSLAGAVSSQMSNLILNNTNLKDVVDNLSTSMAQALATPGDANSGVNAFKNNNFKDQMDNALAPFMPLIEQISASTQGMFGIMQSQTFNAPTGFKLDDYTYELLKGKSMDDVGKMFGFSGGSYWAYDNQNSAGSPMGWPSGNGQIQLQQKQAPTGVPTTVTQSFDPIRDVNTSTAPVVDDKPIYTLQNTTITQNPVLDILNRIAQDKQSFVGTDETTLGNKQAHDDADAQRQILARIAPDVARAIGDGETGMNLSQLKQYMQSTDFSSYQTSQTLTSVQSSMGAVDNNTGKALTAAQAQVTLLNSINQGITTLATVMRNPYAPIPSPPPHVGGGGGGGGNSGGGGSNDDSGGGSSTPTPPPSTSNNGGGGSSIPYNYGSNWDNTTPSTPNNNFNGYTPDQAIAAMQGTIDAMRSGAISGDEAHNDNLNIASSQGWSYSATDGHYYDSDGNQVFHKGGIAGLGNFMSASGLAPNEIGSILQKNEYIFQPAQLSNLIGSAAAGSIDSIFGGYSGTANSSSSDININITLPTGINGSDKDVITEAVRQGVNQALNQMGRDGRMKNLQVKGVSYTK